MRALKANAFNKRRNVIKRLLCLIITAGIFILIIFNVYLNSKFKYSKILKTKLKFNQKCRDWHDYKQIYKDLMRQGLGENGAAVTLTDQAEIDLNKKLLKETGFAIVVSDKISVNRSIQDTRHPKCQNYLYPSELPSVSIIIIFHNEVFSVLKRTLHSIVNRTPSELIHEIILVNDLSTNEELYDPLQKYIDENFKSTTIRIKNLKERKGLIVTRLEGAVIATGEVLVFFDSHTEVNVNWLPPLLTPIKANRRLATNPTIDYFSPETFKVGGAPFYSDRGGFDWNLVYHHFHRKVLDDVNMLKPYPNPIVLGCAFAIDRKFFMEELDGYDREFRIWNAENYEFSLKMWLCADGLYEVPCSRITHTFRRHNPSRANIPYDYLGRNFKRLVEVWFDEYKEVIYDQNRERYDKIDPGDLTHVKAVRERLKCKNFQYFLDYVIPEMILRYPINKDVPVFAAGQIRSLKNKLYCFNFAKGQDNNEVRLKRCLKKENMQESQFFRLGFYKNIIFGFTEDCLDRHNMGFMGCHYGLTGNQFWRYHKDFNMINGGSDEEGNCITADFENLKLIMKPCDIEDENQRWKFSYENVTALDNWVKIYGYEKFFYGEKGMNYSLILPLKYDEECPMD